MNYKKEIVKDFNKLQGKFSTYELWCDFLEMSSVALANSVSKVGYKEREKRYMDIVKKYNKDELDIFCKILGKVTLALSDDFCDLLGDLYMEMELYNTEKGQFFTPYNLSQLCSSIVFDKERIDRDISKRGYTTMHEPSVGGGGMCVGLIEKMLEEGYNPQEQLYIECGDLDIKAVHMTYITLSLYGIPAKVYHMNTLTLEKFSEWHTPAYVMNYIKYK